MAKAARALPKALARIPRLHKRQLGSCSLALRDSSYVLLVPRPLPTLQGWQGPWQVCSTPPEGDVPMAKSQEILLFWILEILLSPGDQVMFSFLWVSCMLLWTWVWLARMWVCCWGFVGILSVYFISPHCSLTEPSCFRVPEPQTKTPMLDEDPTMCHQKDRDFQRLAYSFQQSCEVQITLPL